ncbi:MAG: Asp/Glu/hydantoin racemase [Candidatus Aminicenantes bacterium]|nr:MAG: Asp/Glu/hydantoin racemase [Candidatus Aminicenantes bacterium]
MKILIINPNSDLNITKAIQKTADEFSRGVFEAMCQPTLGAPAFIETYEDAVKAAPGMIQLVRENEDSYEAFIVACHSDPHLDTIKEITRKPVVGIGEASMKMASMLWHSFSVVSDNIHSIPNKEFLARQYHLQDALASVRAPQAEWRELSDEEKYLRTARLAIEEDRAEVIVLGCAAMTGLDKPLQKKLGVPVLDGIVCALIIAHGLARYGVSTSKIRRYNPEG